MHGQMFDNTDHPCFRRMMTWKWSILIRVTTDSWPPVSRTGGATAASTSPHGRLRSALEMNLNEQNWLFRFMTSQRPEESPQPQGRHTHQISRIKLRLYHIKNSTARKLWCYYCNIHDLRNKMDLDLLILQIHGHWTLGCWAGDLYVLRPWLL